MDNIIKPILQVQAVVNIHILYMMMIVAYIGTTENKQNAWNVKLQQ